MIRVVADTNVLISALMFDGLPGVFLELALSRAFTLVSSTALLDELDEKLRDKFGVPEADARLIRSRLESTAELADANFTLHVVADDPDDDRVLECAVAGKAEFVISGDRHLLQLGTYEEISIVTVRQFLTAAGLGS